MSYNTILCDHCFAFGHEDELHIRFILERQNTDETLLFYSMEKHPYHDCRSGIFGAPNT